MPRRLLSMKTHSTVIGSGKQLLTVLARQERKRLLFSVLIGAMATVLLILQWYFIADLVQRVVIEHAVIHYSGLWVNLVLLFIVVVLRPWLLRWQDFLSAQASQAIRYGLRRRLLAFWQSQSALAQQAHSPAALASHWLEDIEGMDGYFARYWPQQYLTLLSPMLIVAVVFYVNWLAGLLLLLSAPLIPLFMALIGMGAEAVNQKHLMQRQRLAGHFLDSVKNLTTIRLFQGVDFVSRQVMANTDGYRKLIMKTLKVAFLSSAVLEFFTSVAVASIAIYIGFSLYGSIQWGPAGQMTLFSGLFVLLLAPEFFQPLRSFAQFYHDRAAALAAANLMVQQYDLSEQSLTQSIFSYEKMAEGSRSTVVNPPPHKSTLAKTNTNSKTSTAPRLEATDLTAAYEGTQASYAPISFQLQQGQTLVITGPSGVGKTTLLLTLAGFMTPHQGRLKNTCLVSKDMNFLPQQPWIIQGSWAENLQVLAPQSTRDQMLDALRFLGFSEHLQRQNEPLSTAILDRPINDHGDGLSGGQLRRLAFARVLLAPKSMIFLDEPTASLDEESRGYVIKALKHLQTHCVMVIASHDSDVLSIADQHRHLAVLNKAPAHA